MKAFKLLLILVSLVLFTSTVFALDVSITPDRPTNNQNLRCNIAGVSSDLADTYEYNWYVNGDRTSVATNIFPASRTFPNDEVLCTVTDFLGAYVGADSVTILPELIKPVNHAPEVEIVNPEDGSVFHTGERINFEALGSDSDGDRVRYSWTFGVDDADDRVGRTPYYTYTETGTFAVTVTATDGSLTSTDGIRITIIEPENQPPVADIQVSDNTVGPGVDINFNGRGSSDPDGTIVRYEWNFGDGTTAFSEQEAHSYTETGLYLVRLTVVDDDGARDTDLAFIFVSNIFVEEENETPVADISVSDTNVAPDESVLFSGTGSFDSDGEIVSYEWNFGDGATASGAETEHSYSDDGTYTVTLTVTDDDGASDSETETIIVETPEVIDMSPVAVAGLDKIVDEDERVFFDGSASFDIGGEIVNSFWIFGDGTMMPGGDAIIGVHTYTEPGVYYVTLVVEDNDGNRGHDELIVTVNEVILPGENQPPVAVIDYEDTTFNVGELIELDGLGSFDSDGEIVSYEWNFGDGATASGAETEHSYSDDGTYTVTLTVTDDDGASDSETVTLYIIEGLPIENQDPVAIIDVDSRNAFLGFPLMFNASRSFDTDGIITNYRWDFGDGSLRNGILTQHIYRNVGVYTVTLTVTDNDGASDTESVVINAGRVNFGSDIEKRRNWNINQRSFDIGRVEPVNYREFYQRGETIALLIKLTNEAGLDEDLDLSVSIPGTNYQYNNIKRIHLDQSEIRWITLDVNLPNNIVSGTNLVKLDLEAHDDSDTARTSYWQFIVV